MKQTRLLMDMPITVEIVDQAVTETDINEIYQYFMYIDETFSTFKESSEISKINQRDITEQQYSKDMKTILDLAEKTKQETNGFFNINHKDKIDPSGIVKGWAIYQAARMLEKQGFKNFFIDAGGDIEVRGKNNKKDSWVVGIRNPFNRYENIKILTLSNCGIATSGITVRGSHIYNPTTKPVVNDLLSLTVIGPNVYEADRFATAAFAMGKEGIQFIESLKDLEGYSIDKNGIATMTSKFNDYISTN